MIKMNTLLKSIKIELYAYHWHGTHHSEKLVQYLVYIEDVFYNDATIFNF